MTRTLCHDGLVPVKEKTRVQSEPHVPPVVEHHPSCKDRCVRECSASPRRPHGSRARPDDETAHYPDPDPNWYTSVPVDEYPSTGGLESWTLPGGRADLALDAAIAGREAAVQSTPDVYEVADKVLAPLLEKQTSVPRRLASVMDQALGARGAKPTRENRLKEAARMLAQERAAADPEMSLALLLRAALLFEPEGGWSSQRPRIPSDGFPTVRALLAAAFSDLRLGAGDINLEVAQNRARTHSLPGEVFISASHCGTANAKNAAAIERACDAQRLIAKTRVHPGDIQILFEKLCLDRFKNSNAAIERRDITIAVRARHARTHGIPLPPRPPLWGLTEDGTPKPRPKKPTPSEQEHADDLLARWFLDAGLALHGTPEPGPDDAGAPGQATCERHVAKRDRTLLAMLDEAENALRRAIGQERRGPTSRRRVQGRIHGAANAR